MLALLLAAATTWTDVQPVLERRCQRCHRPGEAAPMSFLTYEGTRPWAKAIREAVLLKKMPPWFADARYGRFRNDASLSKAESDTLAAWAAAGAPGGKAGVAKAWPAGWNLAPDAVFEMPQAYTLPAHGDVPYQLVIVPTGFATDRWVEAAEVRPGDRRAVHHAVVYVREPGSEWLKGVKPGVFYAPAGATGRERLRAAATTSDILAVYTPGTGAMELRPGQGKLIKAGSDLVFQMHYTPIGKPARDRTRIGLRFAKTKPAERVLTLQMGNDRFLIPGGHPDYRVSVRGSLPNDAALLSFLPHMHLRGRWFEYRRVREDGSREVLLRVDPYDFYWQLQYELAEPLKLPAGTRLEFEASFDNSRRNPHNPDPEAAVWFGEQSWEEMMIGFFDVTVPADVDKERYFVRP